MAASVASLLRAPAQVPQSEVSASLGHSRQMSPRRVTLDLHALREALLKEGLASRVVDKIMGDNAAALFRRVLR